MISRTSEYAIRSLTFMASRPPGEFHLALDMAQELGIPAAFLGKVLQPLVMRGLLHSQRGRGGGFRLAQDPAQISLLSIVRALDQEDLRPQNCPSNLSGDGSCCLLHTEKVAHERAFQQFLERTNLAQMAASASLGKRIPVAALSSTGPSSATKASQASQ
jgi:Rrf2 family protein